MPDIRQQSTIDALAQAFCSNGRKQEQAMIGTGYSKAYASSYCGVMWDNDRVIKAIAKIDADTRQEHIADRAARQQFWTETMHGAASMADKLRASELLGRSEADFTDNIQDSRGDTPDPLSEQELAWLRELAGRMPHLSKETG